MHRLKLTICYDGSKFFGSQIQKDSKKHATVLGTMTKALQQLNINEKIVASGRTDRDVHALNQIIHIDVPDFWQDSLALQISLNKIIAPHILIKKIQKVDESFHARYSAKKRLYRYVLRDKEFNPFFAPYTLHVKNIDTAFLDEVLQNYKGIYDFEYFKKKGSDNKSDIREIYKSGAYRYKDFIIIYFLGNSFLRSQIRMMSKFALDVVDGKFTQENLREQLQKNKKHSTSLVIPNGLYLSKIYY